jgi:hypothetical protein
VRDVFCWKKGALSCPWRGRFAAAENDLDRRSLYAVATNEGGTFTQEEQTSWFDKKDSDEKNASDALDKLKAIVQSTQ